MPTSSTSPRARGTQSARTLAVSLFLIERSMKRGSTYFAYIPIASDQITFCSGNTGVSDSTLTDFWQSV